MLLITIVLTLWTICFIVGAYLLALAFVSWLDREVTFKDDLSPIESYKLINRKEL